MAPSKAPEKVVKETQHCRSVVSRFGGMIDEGHAVAIPTQTWKAEDPALWGNEYDFNARHPASHPTLTAGIPGYSGFRPHGNSHLFPDDTELPKPHGRDLFALDTTQRPTYMPPPGYSGHLRATKESFQSFGTSHWKPVVPISRQQAAAMVSEAAVQRALGLPSAIPVQGRDKEGDGLYTIGTHINSGPVDPEAAEANELLELRSLGLRTAQRKAAPIPGGAGGGLSPTGPK